MQELNLRNIFVLKISMCTNQRLKLSLKYRIFQTIRLIGLKCTVSKIDY